MVTFSQECQFGRPMVFLRCHAGGKTTYYIYYIKLKEESSKPHTGSVS